MSGVKYTGQPIGHLAILHFPYQQNPSLNQVQIKHFVIYTTKLHMEKYIHDYKRSLNITEKSMQKQVWNTRYISQVAMHNLVKKYVHDDKDAQKKKP